MHVSGHEDWSASKIARLLMGDDIVPGDVDGLHGAVIVLCNRVAELESKVSRLRRQTVGHVDE